MKIALLNLQYDNNYGGNLQRYALITVLNKLGHQVVHLNLRFNYIPRPWYSRYYIIFKRLMGNVIRLRKCNPYPEYHFQKAYNDRCKITDVFYERYIQHTKPIYSKKGLAKQTNYDAFIVGSDQVWRKTIASIYGISTFFFDYFPPGFDKPLIAYGVSLGTSENELTVSEIEHLKPLYNRFKAVSVREDSALKLIESYEWGEPSPFQVLDPTLLLDKDAYISLTNSSATKNGTDLIICYILDINPEIVKKIEDISKEKELPYIIVNIDDNQPSVEQWLRYFNDANYIVTDSYHGFIFATIFNKDFTLIRNNFRGNARFDSIIETLYKGTSIECPNWDIVNNNISEWQNISMRFLQENLNQE